MPAAADDEAQAEVEGPGMTPFLVPPATGNNAVITVKVGGDRTSLVAVGPLAGVTLQLYDGAATPTTPVADTWATCVSDADGDCSFIVANTQVGGANRDRRFWVVQTGVPTDWYTNLTLGTGSTGSTQTPYQFRTGTLLQAGQTYSSQGSFMLGTGNTNNTASGGIWQSSRVNPTFPAQCGIDVALVLDLSGSVAPDLPELKAAASTFVDSLTGTPSNVGLFTFSSLAPAANNPNLALTPVSTAASAQLIKDRIDSYTAVGGTNWDRGIYQVATDSTDYDVAVVITDGNPTFYGNQEGPGNFTRLREVENGVFSANAVKDQGTHMVAFGVGAGIGSAGSGLNLRAISGTASGTDYFQTPDYEEAGNQLRALALGNCAGSVSVVKQVVPSTAPVGSIEGAQPSGGWELAAESQTGGVTVDAPATATTAVGTGAANFGLTFAGGTTSGTVGVMETQQPGFTLQQVDGANAVCTNILTGDPVTVTNDGVNGFDVPVTATAAVTCTIYNRAPSPVASLVVNKTWVVNGQSFADGLQPGALTAAAQVAGTPQAWGVPRTGLQQGQSIAVAETTTNGLQGCTFVSQRVTNVNGTATDLTLPSSVTLVAGANSAMVTNTVTCESKLTLAKTVQGGPASPTAWNLDAIAPGGALAGPNGVNGSDEATALVTPGVVYPLAESGGDPNYAQVRGPNAVIIPGSTGSWLCVELAADGTTVIPGFSDGLNGGVNVPLGRWIRCTAVNQTATLSVEKIVDNNFGGVSVPGDWSITITPVGTVPPGVEAQTIRGDDPTPVAVRPGVTYQVSESGLPTGYVQTSASCETEPGVPRDLTVTLQALDTASCTFVNADTPARLTLTKVVDVGSTRAEEVPRDWTLTATPDDVTGQDPVSGNGDPATPGGVSQVQLLPGAYDLTESEIQGFESGQWSCTGATVTGARVEIPVGGDVSCRIVNTALQPTLTLVKEVQNGTTGGTAAPDDWTLTAAGPVTVSGPSGSPEVTSAPVAIGVYALSESGPAGYEAGDWVCGGDPVPGGVITIALAVDVTCVITNTAQPSTLTLVKEVVNDDGGSAEPTDWTLEADGPTPLTGVSGDPAVTGADVEVGDYALSETGGPAGYEAADWTCEIPAVEGGEPTPVPVEDGSVSVEVGQTIVCTIVNDDVPAPFTVVKSSDPGNGATVLPGDVITYTVTATRVGEGFDRQVVVTDDLSQVLNNATLVEGSIEASTGGVVLTGTNLVWTIGDLEDTETITYQVKVADGAYGVTLTNVVTSPGVESCIPPVEPEPELPEPQLVPQATALVTDATALAADVTAAAVAASPTALAVVDPEVECRTTSHVTPAWTLAKTSDPVTGSTVEAGSVITYTLTVTSTTDALVSGAVVRDDLSKVLAYGTLVSPPPGTTLSGTTLTWAVPDLATAGATVAISYQVKLSSSAHGVTVTNVATPGPGGGCVTCTTTHKTPPVSATPPSSLPATGADVAGILTGALLLVLLGGTLVTVRRRRANS
jgi:fimbrial isopeptide formation D2 family protein